jgi:hypothetical protein
MRPSDNLCPRIGGAETVVQTILKEKYQGATLRRESSTPSGGALPHINTGDALIGRFRAFMQPFCGAASKNLAAYGRWHAARDNADRSYLDALRPLLASGPLTNTFC